MGQVVKIAANGRLVLPKAAREALGLEDAGVLALSIDKGEVRLTSMRERIKHAQALYRQHAKDDYSSEDFLRERREEAEREDAKLP